MTNEPKYIHRGLWKLGKPHFDNPDMYEKKKFALEGKRFEMVLESEEIEKTRSQLGYYFGGIIEECINSESFAGWEKDEIHKWLVKKITQYQKTIVKPNGEEITVTCEDDFSSFSKEKTVWYIEKVLVLLAMEFNIHPKEPHLYHLGKYEHKQKK